MMKLPEESRQYLTKFMCRNRRLPIAIWEKPSAMQMEKKEWKM